MSARRRVIVVLAFAIAAALTGCAQPATTTPTVAPTVDVEGWTPAAVTPAPDASAADQVAVAFMQAFVATSRSPNEWFDGIAPYLSSYARTAYADTDPNLIPARHVIGPAEIISTSDVAAQVRIPTDAGTYLVQLARTDPAGGWEVDRAIAPGAEQ
ncbi:hypothetical protein [Leifsonia sp. TF02-11]|uniref:hypothetical protein n=1 Tax=Leifsonia sp. TF02-11 TaxID=2815212 RepID=UPI001AA0D2D2|nr:hypothetical protein [Leifsonia sp. TF02-11]MBO1741026.1 hypothetical protein [Leifsonia sp. TF02-11]